MAWTNEEIEIIADNYWQTRIARCPLDNAILEINESRELGRTTAKLYMHCFRCGSHSFWPLNKEETVKKNNQIIPAGKEYTARKAIKDIINAAQNIVQIIDQYFIGDDAFTLLLALPINVKIEILVSSKAKTPSLSVDVDKFRKEWGGQIEIKTNSDLHGRNIILDKKDVYIIDHSLKDAGKALTSLHKPDDNKEIIDHFNEKWNSGKVLDVPGKDNVSVKQNSKEKYQTRNDLIKRGKDFYKEHSQVTTFLLTEYEYLKDMGWSKEDFENIYQELGVLCKGKPFKQPLFS